MDITRTICATFILAACAARAETYQVTSLADSGPGSLRDAIATANASIGVADTIRFATGGTITLASRLPEIEDTLTIDGTGAGITVSGNNAVQVLRVGAGQTLALRGITIANGFCASPCSGGAVLNAGTLNVADSSFTGNAALLGGAIHNFGTLRVTDSRFVANAARFGGAIHNFDTLSVADSTFTGNSASTAGAAIYNFDVLDIAGGAFAGNLAAQTPGDIANAVGGRVTGLAGRGHAWVAAAAR